MLEEPVKLRAVLKTAGIAALTTTLVAGGSAASYAASEPSASIASEGAASPSASGGGIITPQADTCYYENRALNSKYAGERTVWGSGPNWNVSGTGPGTLSLSRQTSVTNSFNASTSVTTGSVNSTVGFDTSKSTSVTTSFSTTLKSGERRTINAGHIDSVYNFEIWRGTICFPGSSGWSKGSKVGTGQAFKYARLTYRTTSP